MEPIVFRYRCRELTSQDIHFIREIINERYSKGRSHISRALCQTWNWIQPNGKLKEYAARDLLLRLEEKGFIKLPPRIRPKNNLKPKRFDQIPLFLKRPLSGLIGNQMALTIHLVNPETQYLWSYLLHHYHYLGLPKLVGEHIKHMACINGQVVACLAWASAAWKIKARDQFIGWNVSAKRKNLYWVANNTRFLIPPKIAA
jgi:hypothetical protein